MPSSRRRLAFARAAVTTTPPVRRGSDREGSPLILRSACIPPPLFIHTPAQAWHLRPECSFYTRVNFFSAVGRVPKNSKARHSAGATRVKMQHAFTCVCFWCEELRVG